LFINSQQETLADAFRRVERENAAIRETPNNNPTNQQLTTIDFETPAISNPQFIENIFNGLADDTDDDAYKRKKRNNNDNQMSR
jgi:hypothetical protein